MASYGCLFPPSYRHISQLNISSTCAIAIRIILDAPREKEYMQCWQTFALITNLIITEINNTL